MDSLARLNGCRIVETLHTGENEALTKLNALSGARVKPFGQPERFDAQRMLKVDVVSSNDKLSYVDVVSSNDKLRCIAASALRNRGSIVLLDKVETLLNLKCLIFRPCIVSSGGGPSY